MFPWMAHFYLQREMIDNGKSIKGAGWTGQFKNGKFEWQTYSTYEDIIPELENTIGWLEMLIENHCGFRAWY